MTKPFIRNLPYSPQRLTRHVFTFGDMSGGLNNADAPSTVQKNQATDCRNMDFSNNYGMEKRNGTTYVYKATVDSPSYPYHQHWADEFTENFSNTKFTITATELVDGIGKLFAYRHRRYVKTLTVDSHAGTTIDKDVIEFTDCTEICTIRGKVKGVQFNNAYYAVDGHNLFKIEYKPNEEDLELMGEFVCRKIISDPKFYIDKINGTGAYKTLNNPDGDIQVPESEEQFNAAPFVLVRDYEKEVTEYVFAGSELDESGEIKPYEPEAEYYVDPFGKVLLEHGAEAGKVNNGNYINYFVKRTSNQDVVYIILRRVNAYFDSEYLATLDSHDFTFSTAIGQYTDVKVETYLDTVTEIVKATISTENKPISMRFERDDVDSTDSSVTVNLPVPTDYEVAETNRLIIGREFLGTKLDEMKDAVEPVELVLLAHDMLEDRLSTLIGRCYTPRPTDYVNGETIMHGEYLWYQPCLNELKYATLGENVIPNCPRSIAVFNNRLWTTGDKKYPNEIRACNVLNTGYFPAALSFGLDATGDVVQDMISFDSALVIGRNYDIFAIYGHSVSQDENTFRIKKMDTTTGFISQNCGTIINNFYIFIGTDRNIYRMNTPTTNTDYLMIKPITTFVDLMKEPLSIRPNDFDDLSCTAVHNYVFWSFGHKVIVVYSYERMAFTYYTGLNPGFLFNDGRELFLTDAGSIIRYDRDVWSDYCDSYADFDPDVNISKHSHSNKKAIIAIYKTKTFNDSPVDFKYFEQMLCTLTRAESPKSSVDITVRFDKQYVRLEKDVFPIHVDLTASKFGYARWGIDPFNSSATKKTYWIKLDVRSRTMAVEFANNKLDESFKLIDTNILFTERDIR